MVNPKQLLALVVGAVTLVTPRAIQPQSPADTANGRAVKIVADEALFPVGFAKTLDWKGMAPDSGWKLWTAVPLDKRPKLTDLQKAHGMEDRMADEDAPAIRAGSVMNSYTEPPPGAPTRRVRVYYYGSIGFGVEAPALPTSVVIVITNRLVARSRE